MSPIKVQPQSNPIEQRAFDQRLERLGLTKTSDGEVETSSAEAIRGAAGQTGINAVNAVATDGMLTAEGAAKLNKQRSFADVLLGRDASISEKQSSAMVSVAMACDGLERQLLQNADVVQQGGTLTTDQINSAQRRTEKLADDLGTYLGDGADLSACAPEAVGQFASSVAKLTTASTEYVAALSQQREELLATPTEMGDAFSKHGALEQLNSAVAQLEVIRAASSIVSLSNVAASAKFETEAEPVDPPLAPASAEDIGALTEQLSRGLEPGQANVTADAEARAANIKTILEEFDKLNASQTIPALAQFIDQTLNPAAEGLSDTQTQGIVLLQYEIPETHPTPNGKQKLVVTKNGIRAVANNSYGSATRVPQAAELAAAGIQWSAVEDAIAQALNRSVHQPDRIMPETVEMCREDYLASNGLQPSVDFEATKGQLQTILAGED